MTVNPLAEKSARAVEMAADRCNYCDAPIVWVVTGAGTKAEGRMPLDAKPAAEGGNVVVHPEPHRLLGQVLGKPAERAAYAAQGYGLHLHHKLSCPHAADWSRPGGPPRGRQHQAADAALAPRRTRWRR